MEPGVVLLFCDYIEDPTNLKLDKYFWLLSASKKTSFDFCSRLEHLQVKFINNTKNLAWKHKLLSFEDSYNVDLGGIITISTILR